MAYMSTAQKMFNVKILWGKGAEVIHLTVGDYHLWSSSCLKSSVESVLVFPNPLTTWSTGVTFDSHCKSLTKIRIFAIAVIGITFRRTDFEPNLAVMFFSYPSGHENQLWCLFDCRYNRLMGDQCDICTWLTSWQAVLFYRPMVMINFIHYVLLLGVIRNAMSRSTWETNDNDDSGLGFVIVRLTWSQLPQTFDTQRGLDLVPKCLQNRWRNGLRRTAHPSA